MKLGLPVGSASFTKKLERPTPPQFLNIQLLLQSPISIPDSVETQDETGELPPETET